MMATTALLATVLPKVGPTDWLLGGERSPKWLCSALSTLASLGGVSSLEEICQTLLPSVLLLTCWTSGLVAPAAFTTLLTCCWVAEWAREAVIRVPEVKSIPRLSPRPPTASAPTSRITPDIVKKYLEAPMKSKRQAL